MNSFDEPAHPPCVGDNSSDSQWSGYRNHYADPLWFEGGVQLLARNGGSARKFPPGGAAVAAGERRQVLQPAARPGLLPELHGLVSRVGV